MSNPAQYMPALERANEIRIEAARQRRALIGAPADVVAAALRNPTPEFGRYKLAKLLLPRGGHRAGVIPRLGDHRLRIVFSRLAGDPSLGRLSWHAQLRLDELNQRERERLVEELLAEAPKTWKAAA